MVLIFILAFMGLIWMTLHEQHRKAKRKYKAFICFQQQWIEQIEQVLQKKDCILNESIDPEALVYLIFDDASDTKVCPLNSNKTENITSSQYRNIIHKLQKNRSSYSYNFQTVSIYCQLRQPFDKYIVWIKYS